MRQVRWASWMGAVALAVAVSSSARAEIASDRAAAIVEYPWVLVAGQGGTDTVIQLSNTADQAVDLHCFYDNANYHCTNTGEVCTAAADCCGTSGCGICYPGWNETDFRVRLTPFQPIAWRASEGLRVFPIDGVLRVGRDGVSSNAGSLIPPVPEDPFLGALKCIAVDTEGNPVDSNVLKGEATLETFLDVGATIFDVAKYNAVGIPAIPGAVNDNRTLVLGTPANPDDPAAEYSGCPGVLILNHFADFAEDPVTGENIETQLVLVPCTEDLLRQRPGAAVVQYLVYNEFEQRFSTSRAVQCQQALPISEIDTTQRQRSVFSAGVLGTIAAQTRLTPIGSGLIGVAIESHDGIDIDDTTLRFDSAATNLYFQGDHPTSDLITLP